MIDSLVEEGVLRENQCSDVLAIFQFERFKGVRNQWTNFSKYILMRIDRYLSELLDKPSYASDGLEELENRFNKNNMKRYGMHLEHIYTQHPNKHAHFSQATDIFDEAGLIKPETFLEWYSCSKTSIILVVIMNIYTR